MKVKAVFFDLGGTLLVMRRDKIFRNLLMEQGTDLGIERVHSAYLGAEPWWLSVYGKRELTPEQTIDAYKDLDAKVYLSLFPDKHPEDAAKFSDIIRLRWKDAGRTVPPELYPDAEPLLSRLKSDHYMLALVSNAPPDTDSVVRALGLARYLEPIVISGLVGYSKPHPEIFRIALRRLSLSPDQVVHVGDLYDSDIVGARNAGIHGVLLDRDRIQGPRDCPTISSLGDLYALLT
jgi:HAD superfamily hydrolase (TIGR01509 family)